MKATLNTKYDDYKNVKGISGANVGIPYNIIIVKEKDGGKDLVFINPAVIDISKEMVEVESNCGSIVLAEPIKIKRYKKILLSWYDEENGHVHSEEFTGRLGNTIQHEVEHNQGILITDKTGKRKSIKK
jgi:peptide deformylase